MKTTTVENSKGAKRVMFRVGLEKEPCDTLKEKTFSNIKEAEEYFDKIEKEVGYHPFIDKIELILDEEELEMAPPEYYINDPLCEIGLERIREGDTFIGKILSPEGVIVTYFHKCYLNYAFKILDVDYVKNTRFYNEGDLITEVRVYRPTFTYFENINELVKEYEKRVGIFAKICGGEDLIKDFIQNFQNK